MDPQTYFHFLPVWVVGNFLTTKREKTMRHELFVQCNCEQMYNSLASDYPRAPCLSLTKVLRTRAGILSWWSSACPEDSTAITQVTFAVSGLLYLAV